MFCINVIFMLSS
jgi:hypothetical protein